jgi:hypothetical protein
MELYENKMNEVEETVFTANDVDVVISYWWDSHGRRVEWCDPNGEFREEIHADSVRIVYKECDLKIYGGDTYRHAYSEAIVDGTVLDALSVEYRKTRGTIYIDAIVGAG